MDFRKGRIPELDGIRGSAILLVVCWHYLVVPLEVSSSPALRFVSRLGLESWSGVDLFFVLSGFLIGEILLEFPEWRPRVPARHLVPSLSVLADIDYAMRFEVSTAIGGTWSDGSATFATDINPNLLVGVALHPVALARHRLARGPWQPLGHEPQRLAPDVGVDRLQDVNHVSPNPV